MFKKIKELKAVMAPESERAKCTQCGQPEFSGQHASRESNGHAFQPRLVSRDCSGGVHLCEYRGECKCDCHATQPSLAPASCSEVVERLHAECVSYSPLRETEFDAKKAEAILHSWRERRVQEADEMRGRALTELSMMQSDRDDLRTALDDIVERAEKYHYAPTLSTATADGMLVNVIDMAKKALEFSRREPKSEWREQIRKGAKHED